MRSRQRSRCREDPRHPDPLPHGGESAVASVGMDNFRGLRLVQATNPAVSSVAAQQDTPTPPEGGRPSPGLPHRGPLVGGPPAGGSLACMSASSVADIATLGSQGAPRELRAATRATTAAYGPLPSCQPLRPTPPRSEQPKSLQAAAGAFSASPARSPAAHPGHRAPSGRQPPPRRRPPAPPRSAPTPHSRQ